MYRRFLSFFGIAALSLLIFSALPADAADATSSEFLRSLAETDATLWEPRARDILLVDVGQSTGYLVHEDGRALQFPVATGRREYVSYIGRYYKADTPIRSWTARQKQIKGDRRTFGVSGRFIRLFRNGESSPYGIHSYFKVADWMQEDERYFSMGCIVVTEKMMDVIERTFDANGGNMKVITTNDAQAALESLLYVSGDDGRS
ncbi:L,D-transpeptidase [Candidatus Peregrinibacteria bacterium]|nr:L,D-transpeptidase [Candidatus Peregrinibacteria bacterium]